jgi:hypothetical protein
MYNKLSQVVALVLVLSLAGGAWADLVGHWRLDEKGGATVADASGNGGDGAVQGNPVWVQGMIGGAMQCDGDDWVNCGNILPLTQGLTIMCWINSGDLNGDRSFASREGAYALKSNSTHVRFTTPGILDYDATAAVLQTGTWTHVAVTFVPNTTGGAIFYLNGVEAQRLNSTGLAAGAGPFRIANNQWADQFLVGIIDDVRVYNTVLTPEEIADAMKGAGPEMASDPVPEDEATDVPADSVLSWTPGELAAAHDVYLGTAFDDVNDASRSDTRGMLASQGQADATFDPEGLLEYGATYYWRIDEVNAAPDNTIFKGQVWSFTAEPFAYPITNVTATASSAQPGMEPENAVDGSGLNANDEHSTELTDMWMASGAAPNWIRFEFDSAYKLDEMLVWNSNQLIEAFLGFGARDVTVEYSTDGETWTALEGVPEFARASGTPTYAANTTVDFGGVMAQFVKLTINSNWGGVAPQTGLSEVRFFAVPVRAREPMPADDATGVSIAAEFNWRPGREATSHEVYFGADANALTLAGTVTEHGFTPDAMDLDTTYYWRVDEVGDTGTYEGEVWSFTTEAFAVVDDMESYNDDDNRIYESWIDGLTEPAKGGSQVGYEVSPFAETTIVHSGGQSMPLIYNNTGVSLAEAEFEVGQDWTASGIQSLSLWFRGAAGNTGTLYVKINNTKVSYDGPAGDIASTQWLPWNIDLSAVGGNLSNVGSLTIGVEGSGAAGTLYIDDIRLYPRTPEFVVPVQPSNTGLVAQWQFENNLRDSVGDNHGTASGDARVATDLDRGQVLSVDGNGDKVDIPYSAALNPPEFTVSCWAWPDAAGTSHRSPITSRDDGPQRGYILYVEPGNTWQFWTGTGTGWNATTGPAAQLDEWNHVTATFVNDQKVLYVNGRQVGQSTAVLSPNTQQPLRIGAGATEGTGNYFFRGLIDDVRLYNRAMSPEEVAGLAGHTTPLPKAF